MSSFGELIKTAIAAETMLRFGQAHETADALQNAVRNALEERDRELTLSKLSAEVNQQIAHLQELVHATSLPRTRQQVEDLLLHYKDGHCASSPEQVAAAIGVLEWVLGTNKDGHAKLTQ